MLGICLSEPVGSLSDYQRPGDIGLEGLGCVRSAEKAHWGASVYYLFLCTGYSVRGTYTGNP